MTWATSMTVALLPVLGMRLCRIFDRFSSLDSTTGGDEAATVSGECFCVVDDVDTCLGNSFVPGETMPGRALRPTNPLGFWSICGGDSRDEEDLSPMRPCFDHCSVNLLIPLLSCSSPGDCEREGEELRLLDSSTGGIESVAVALCDKDLGTGTSEREGSATDTFTSGLLVSLAFLGFLARSLVGCEKRTAKKSG